MNSVPQQAAWRGERALLELSWDRRFCMRQVALYATTDVKICDGAPQDEIVLFLTVGLGLLDPPCFNFEVLEHFLVRGNILFLKNANLQPEISPLALLDDRRDPAGLKATPEGQPIESNGQTRNWDSLEYTKYPPRGSNIYREVLNERELYNKLLEMRSLTGAERRVLYITNLTSLCAVALAATVAIDTAPILRAYLHRYLSGQIYFRTRLNRTNFVMEFHIPYFALRKGRARADGSRELRQRHKMLKPKRGSVPDLWYYDAQISFLLTGVDEWHWTAYCCVDNFFGAEHTADKYKQDEEDGPSGGETKEAEPLWNPRSYFLVVLSCRISQVTREWANIIHVLSTRLDSYEMAYNKAIDTEEFFDYPDLRLTRAYTRAVSILRQFHDSLFLVIELFQEFASQEMQYFRMETEVVNNNWRDYIDSIDENIAELRLWQRTLSQRTQTFDRMKEGLVDASALKESRTAVSQGDDIGVLTNMTVAYLPFGLAAVPIILCVSCGQGADSCNLRQALYSMPTVEPQTNRWVYWAVTCVIIGLPTFYFAFGHKIKKWWDDDKSRPSA